MINFYRKINPDGSIEIISSTEDLADLGYELVINVAPAFATWDSEKETWI